MMAADSPVIDAGLFSFRQTSLPEDQLEGFLTYRAGRMLNMVTPPVLCFIGVTGNVLTLLVLSRSALRTTACCKYLAVLALSDMAVLLLHFCFGFVDVFLYELLTSDIACKMYYFLFFTCAHLSAWLLVAVTAQRCFVVCRPMTSLTVTSKRCTACVIGGLTAASVILNAHHLVIRKLKWSERTEVYTCHTEGHSQHVFVRDVWPWVDACVYCFLPSLCLIVLNILIVRALRKAAVFRKSLQCHRQKVPRQTTSVSTIKDGARVLSVVNREVVSVQASNIELLSSERAFMNSHRDDNAIPEAGVELKILETRSRTYYDGLETAKTSTSSELPVSENTGSVPTPDSIGNFSIRTSTDSHPVSPCSGASSRHCTRSLPFSKERGRGNSSQTSGNSDVASVSFKSNNVSNHFSLIDLTTNSRNNSHSSSLLFKKRRCYDMNTKTFKLGRLVTTSQNNSDVLGLSLDKRTESDVQTVTPTTNDGGSQRKQTRERESQSRQLTLMPLMASLVFVTLSAPLAVMLVAEHTIWVRSSPEQVAEYALIRMVTNALMYLNHSVNFLLYCFAGSTFRRQCCSLFCRGCPCLSGISPCHCPKV